MIDIFGDDPVFPLAEAIKLLPPSPAGRKRHIATLHRWSTKGSKGVRLETLSIGGQRVTTKAALNAFFAAVTRASNRGPQTEEPRTTAARSRAIAKANRELERAGM